MHWKNPGDGVSFQMHQDCTFRTPARAYRQVGGGFPWGATLALTLGSFVGGLVGAAFGYAAAVGRRGG
jgi:hypothetical protein